MVVKISEILSPDGSKVWDGESWQAIEEPRDSHNIMILDSVVQGDVTQHTTFVTGNSNSESQIKNIVKLFMEKVKSDDLMIARDLFDEAKKIDYELALTIFEIDNGMAIAECFYNLATEIYSNAIILPTPSLPMIDYSRLTELSVIFENICSVLNNSRQFITNSEKSNNEEKIDLVIAIETTSSSLARLVYGIAWASYYLTSNSEQLFDFDNGEISNLSTKLIAESATIAEQSQLVLDEIHRESNNIPMKPNKPSNYTFLEFEQSDSLIEIKIFSLIQTSQIRERGHKMHYDSLVSLFISASYVNDGDLLVRGGNILSYEFDSCFEILTTYMPSLSSQIDMILQKKDPKYVTKLRLRNDRGEERTRNVIKRGTPAWNLIVHYCKLLLTSIEVCLIVKYKMANAFSDGNISSVTLIIHPLPLSAARRLAKVEGELNTLKNKMSRRDWDELNELYSFEFAHIKQRNEELKESFLKNQFVNSYNSDCFIATAAYGSIYHHKIDVLRNWRDQSLRKSVIGRAFIKSYYIISPPIADAISSSSLAKRIVRLLLKPIVFLLSMRYGSKH